MLDLPIRLQKPGVVITGTDTDVGKTVASCAIAAAWRLQNPGGRLGVSKPFASGCRKEREGLVSGDAEALAHFADCRQSLDVVNPIRFLPPLAPAVAAEQTRKPIDWDGLWRSLTLLDEANDALLIEGVGGLMVPLDPDRPKLTFLHFIRALDYPVVVVARSILGTLNHTAMTIELLRLAGCRIAGIVMNGYEADAALSEDPSIASNREWLQKLTDTPILAVLPRVAPDQARPETGEMHTDLVAAAAAMNWRNVMTPPGS